MRNILITGAPGCGKSTVINKIIELIVGLTKSGSFNHPATGFVTTELRSGSYRQGFEIVTLAGKRATLAHINLPKTYVVGKYGVDVDTFEAIAVEELQKPTRVCIIDEIGKMETQFSKRFNPTVKKILDDPNIMVIGTIAMRGGGFISEVQKRKDVEIIEVTPANRNELPNKLLQDIVSSFSA